MFSKGGAAAQINANRSIAVQHVMDDCVSVTSTGRQHRPRYQDPGSRGTNPNPKGCGPPIPPSPRPLPLLPDHLKRPSSPSYSTTITSVKYVCS